MYSYFLVLSNTSLLVSKQSHIQQRWQVPFVSAFLVKLKSLVRVFLSAVPQFVANAQVVKSSSAPPFSRLPEPLARLVLVLEFVVKKSAQSVHGYFVALKGSVWNSYISCRFLVLSYGQLQVLVVFYSVLVKVAHPVERLLAVLLSRLLVEFERQTRVRSALHLRVLTCLFKKRIILENNILRTGIQASI